MKTYQKQIIKKIPLVCFILVMATLLDAVIAKTTFFVLDPVPQFPIAEVQAKTRTEIYPKPENPVKEWVLTKIYDAGLNPDEADKIIECESHWNTEAHKVNWDNKKGLDRGLWQINTLFHPEVSNSCSYDYRCSTEEAIRIYKERGNWSAWECSKNL